MKRALTSLIAVIFCTSLAFGAVTPSWQVSRHKDDRWDREFPDDLKFTPGIDLGKKIHLPWDPSGQNNFPTGPECQPEALRERIWRDPSSVRAQARNINQWIDQCEKQISTPRPTHSFEALLSFSRVNYRFAENKNIYYVSATLPDGRALTGMIALKPGKTPRPLIIAKCGVFCNAEQGSSNRNYMMQLFDESPFNVLVLANNTGTKFQIGNGAMSLGGFDEGRQLYQIAELIRHRESPIASLISSVHIVGTSLGGNGALFSGVYFSANDIQAVQSITALCPVVVLENAVRRLYFSRGISPLVSWGTMKVVRDIFYFVPVLGQAFTLGRRYLAPAKVYDQLTHAALDYYQGWTEQVPWDTKPFEGVRIKSLPQFFALNDYRNYVAKVRVPTLVIDAQNDSVVRSRENANLLSDELRQHPNPNVDVVSFENGNHCAFSVANGWSNVSTLLREYILSHAPEARAHWKTKFVELPELPWRPRKGDFVMEAFWQARVGNPNLQLSLKVFNDFNPRSQRTGLNTCRRDQAYRAPMDCYRIFKMDVPIAALPVDGFGVPQNEYESTALTRYANTRFEILNADKKSMLGGDQEPKFLRARMWE